MTEIRALRSYAEVSLGRQRSPQHDQGPHMVPYLRAANVKDGHLDLDDVKEMNFTPAEQQVFSLRPGDVLVTEGSGSLGAVGASAVWQGEIDGTVCFQNTLLRLRPRRMTDGRFLGWWCRHAFADGLFAAIATGANIFHVSAERVRSLPTTYMDLTLQRAIADFLDAETARVDALIAKKRCMIDLARTRCDRMLDCAALPGFDPGVRQTPSDVPLEHETPADWAHVSLASAVTRISYGFTNPMPATDEGPWMLTANDVRDGQINFDDARHTDLEAFQRLTAKSRPARGDTLLTKDGTLGRVAFLDEAGVCVNQSVAVLSPRPEVVMPELLSLLLRVPAYREALIFNAGGTTIKHLYISRVAKQRVALPVRDSQPALHARLSGIIEWFTSLAERLTRQIELLQEHRQALITAAVTGEFDVAPAA